MAKLLEDKVKEIPQIKITQKVQANGVFAMVPKKIMDDLKQEYFFYDWDESQNEVRWMCSFDTKEEDILTFVELIKSKLNAS
jgi:threonine aldolase